MRILILNTDYPAFLEWHYTAEPALERAGYAEQFQARARSLFSTADFYSRHLRALGHEAQEVFANNGPMQLAWARERGLRVGRWWPWRFVTRRRFLPVSAPWFRPVLEAQVNHFQPDVLFNQATYELPPDLLRRLKRQGVMLVGQHAATTLPGHWDWRVYDLMLSSFPPTVEWFRKLGVHTELFRLGFEARILEQVAPTQRDIGVSFIGSFQAVHESRRRWLEYVRERVEVEVWSPDTGALRGSLSGAPPVHGAVWGAEMFRVLGRSRLTLNHHGSVPPFANNMRLYEATGMGAALVTDWKANLHELFEPGREVIAYRDADECVELIRHFLQHEEERQRIASAGQARTLREHTYAHRMAELVRLIESVQA